MDMVYHIDAAKRVCGSVGKMELEHDEARYLACMYCIVVVAEAAGDLSEDMRAKHAEIAWKNLIGMGVALKHHYFRVEADIVWDAVNVHFPALREVASSLLEGLADA